MEEWATEAMAWAIEVSTDLIMYAMFNFNIHMLSTEYLSLKSSHNKKLYLF